MSESYGIDLLNYPEKFDIALKLVNLREKYLSYKQGVALDTAFNLKYNQPDSIILAKILKPNVDYHVTSYIQPLLLQNVWLQLTPKEINDQIKKYNWKSKTQTAWKEFTQLNIYNLFKSLPIKELNSVNKEWKDYVDRMSKTKCIDEALCLYGIGRLLLMMHKELSLKCSKWLEQPYPKPDLDPIEFSIKDKEFSIKMGWDLGVVELNGEHFLLDRDLFLLIVNKISELACALMYVNFQSTLFGESGVLKLKTFLLEITKPMIKWYNTHGDENQEAYNIPKTMEAIGVGIILEVEDLRRGWKNDYFIRNTLQGLIDNKLLPRTEIDHNSLYLFLHSLTTPEIAELIGSIKLVGHPDIDYNLGLETLYERTHMEFAIDENMIKQTQGALVHEFVQNYYSRHKSWPPLTIPDDSKFAKLKASVQSNLSPIAEEFNIMNPLIWEDWAEITIQECIEYDFWESPLEFIKDTALGANKKQALEYCLSNHLRPRSDYQTVQKEINRTKSYQISDSNRLVIQFLLSPVIYQKSLEYRKNWAQNGDWDDVLYSSLLYMTIKLTAKEREEKFQGRFFGASPSYERDRRIQTEGEVSKLMRDYFPEQMLTATELEFNQKLLKFRNYRRLYPNHYVVQLCFDFQAWNNYMRAEFIDKGIGEKLNGIFNTHAYSRIMKFYQNALIYAESPRDLFAWIGQKGGIEGLNQSTWTLATLMGLKVALSKLGFKFEVSVKGDDCRAAILIPHNECDLVNLQQEIDRIKDVLVDYCQLTGMTLKPDETFQSLCLIASSKQYQLDDILLPCGLKQAIKIAHHTNSAFPTSQNIVSDLMSSCHSACYSTPFLIQTWVMGILISLWRLSLDYQLLKTLNTWEIVGLCLWPQILGGPGLLPLEVFIVRGENDMLSIIIDLFHVVMNFYGPNHDLTKILWRILRLPDAKKPSYRLLLSDPYSLNKEHPLTPTQYLKSQVLRKIKVITRNPMLRKLFTTNYEDAEKTLIRILLSINPFHVKIAVAIYENSPFSQLNKVLQRIDNASSIFVLLGSRKGMVSSRQGMRILSNAHKLHQQQIHWWVNVLSGSLEIRLTSTFYGIKLDEFLINCPTESTQKARDASWKIPMFGITYPSLSRQFHLILADQNFPPEFSINFRPNCGIYNVCGTNELFPQSNHDHPYFCAPKDPSPWIGGKTQTKVSFPGNPKLHKSASLPKVITLLEVMARVQPICPDLLYVIKWCIRIMIPLTEDEFAKLLPEISGGSFGHRGRISSYSLVTTPNFRHNIIQSIKHNFDKIQFTHTELSLDYTLNFMAIVIFHSFILTHKWMLKTPNYIIPKCRYYMLIHQETPVINPFEFKPCSYCLNDVSDVQLNVEILNLPELDLSENALIILPECDQVEIRNMVSIVSEQRQLQIMALLNANPRGSAMYLQQSHYAILNKLLMESRAHNEHLHHVAPGGLLSDAMVQLYGNPFNPIPLKFLSFLDPREVCNKLIEFAQLELLALYPRNEIEDLNYKLNYPTGVRNNILPIINLYVKAGSLPFLTNEMRESAFRLKLKSSFSGNTISSSLSISHWFFEIARLQIIKSSSSKDPTIIRIVTSQNQKNIDLLIHIQDILRRLLESMIGFKWQRFYKSDKGYFWTHKEFDGGICNNFCRDDQDDDYFLNWLGNRIMLNPGESDTYWLIHALLLPCCIDFNINTEQQLIAAYHSIRSIPAFTSKYPETDVYIESAEAFNSISNYLGINVSSIIFNQCGHHPNLTINSWIEFLNFLVGVVYNPIQYAIQFNCNFRQKWKNKIERTFHLDINHMDIEAAYVEIIENPTHPSNYASQIQSKLQNPQLIHQVNKFNVTFRQFIFPMSIHVLPADRKTIIRTEIPPLPDIIRDWCNWNQHLRTKSYSGSAASKLFEILHQLGITRNRIDHAIFVCLADGRGGFATLLNSLYPTSSVYFNTHLGFDCTPGDIPADWLANIRSTDRLYCNLSDEGDLVNDFEVNIIIQQIQSHLGNETITLLTFDAEFYGMDEISDYLNMLTNVSKIYSKLAGPQSILIMKLFYYDIVLSHTSILYLIDSCQQYRLIKPSSSRETNREFYLVIIGCSYPISDFPGAMHHRRATRYLTSLRNLITNWTLPKATRQDKIIRLLPPFFNSRHPPILKIRNVESSLYLPDYSLKHEDLWMTNQIVPRLQLFLSSVESQLIQGTRHRLTSGRRRVGVGGVRTVLEWTHQYVRLTAACHLLDHCRGPLMPQVNSIEEGFALIHDNNTLTYLNYCYTTACDFIKTTDYWKTCQDHDDCITSDGAYLSWANEPVHLNLVHEFGSGCDIAIRILTIMLVHSHIQLPYDVFKEFIS